MVGLRGKQQCFTGNFNLPKVKKPGTIMKLFAALILMFIHFNILGQATASFKASATIVTPDNFTPPGALKISRINSANSKGNHATARRVRVNSDDLKLGEVSLNNLAGFQLEGESYSNLRINLPDGELMLSNGKNQLKIQHFSSNRSIPDGLNKNQDILELGAAVLVENKLEPGLYTSPDPVEIIIDYD